MKEYIVQAYAPETIKTFEEHNAPQIVRCKDCKHWNLFNGCNKLLLSCHADWFCADGEAKDDG